MVIRKYRLTSVTSLRYLRYAKAALMPVAALASYY